MLGKFSALLSALALALSVVSVRKSLDESNFMSIAFVITVTSNIVLWPLALLFTNLRTFNSEGILFFVVAGVFSPAISNLLYFRGMRTIGVSANASIVATFPMYSSLFSVLLLNETLALENWIGIVCIIVGALFVERSVSKPRSRFRIIYRKDLVYSFLAALTVALSFVVRKQGLSIHNEPVLGIAVGFFSSLLIYLLLPLSSYTRLDSMFSGKDFRLFWKAGVGMSVGSLLAFFALSQEKVSIVTPLMQTQPLFILLFSSLYLRTLEHVSFELVSGALLITLGVMLVALS